MTTGSSDPLAVVVPAPDSRLRDTVWEGSGIVASRHDASGRIRVTFEGDDAVYPRYADRVQRAAERHEWTDGRRRGYPSVAAAFVDREELILVGSYHSAAGRVEVSSPDALRRWLGVEQISPQQLSATR